MDTLVFKARASDVLLNLKERIADSVHSMHTPDGRRVARAVDLERALGINRTLAWQVHQLVSASEPLAAVDKVPKPAAMESFIEAISERFGSEIDLAGLHDAYGEFESLVSGSAQTRDAFVSMVAGLDDSRAEAADLVVRRNMFKAQSSILGIESDAHLALALIHPNSEDANYYDAAIIRGVVGLRRLRNDSAWFVSSFRQTDDGGKSIGEAPRPLFDGTTDAGLIHDFCSPNLPHLQYHNGTDGSVSIELQPVGIGATSAVDCMYCQVYRAVGLRFRTENRSVLGCRTELRTPAKVAFHDVLIHRSIISGTCPESAIYTDHRCRGSHTIGRERDIISSDCAEYLGDGIAKLATAEVPRYPKMVQVVLDHLGWDASSFCSHRLKANYPPMPSSLVMKWDLPSNGS